MKQGEQERAFVAVLMGSGSDMPVMQAALEVLDGFEVPCEARVCSAHRTPEALHEYVREAERRGCGVFIAAAGLAAHLAGSVAALTLKPVLGVPIDAGPLKGVDALLSTVQMPAGVPVACMALGSVGARNAAYFAAQLLAVADSGLAARIADERRRRAERVQEDNQKLQRQLPRQ